MILSRRKAHLVSFLTLAVLLPITFLAGIIFRPQFTAVDESADSLFEKAVEDENTLKTTE